MYFFLIFWRAFSIFWAIFLIELRPLLSLLYVPINLLSSECISAAIVAFRWRSRQIKSPIVSLWSVSAAIFARMSSQDASQNSFTGSLAYFIDKADEGVWVGHPALEGEK
jgi:hypothetical protein